MKTGQFSLFFFVYVCSDGTNIVRSVSEIRMSKGITIANVVGLYSANAEIKVLAGYLALSVLFICIALVKGVGSFIHLAGQMTDATTSAGDIVTVELLARLLTGI